MDLRTFRRPSAVGVWASGALVALCLAGCGRPSEDSATPEVESTADLPRAETLYAQHCAACHGDNGDGKGLAAVFLFPKPRDFRSGRFRLVSTANGVPTLEDIEAVIDRGIPGSSMPPWAHLASEDRRLLAERVLELRRQGARDVEIMLAADEEIELSDQELEEAVARVTTPGPVLEVPEFGEPTDEVIARGKELYLAQGCASCHGKEGKGDGAEVQIDAEGYPTRPRDYTQGIFKGGHDPASLYRRIAYGMPGTPMPSSKQLAPEQNAEMVHFIRSLSDEKTREAAVLKRERLVAQRVDEVSGELDAPFWDGVPAVGLRMFPLWWRDDPDPWIEAQAAHDGETLTVRLSWSDPQADAQAIRSEAFQDAVAVELYRGEPEPFLGMGTQEHPVDVWMWGADRDGSPGDVEDANPNVVVDIYPLTESIARTAEYDREGTTTAAQSDISLTAQASGNQIVSLRQEQNVTAGSLEAGGPGSVSFRLPTSQLVAAKGEWKDGRWTAVFRRPLVVGDATNGVSLEPGDRVSIAFAVWDGSHRDRDGQKRITIWQDLELAAP